MYTWGYESEAPSTLHKCRSVGLSQSGSDLWATSLGRSVARAVSPLRFRVETPLATLGDESWSVFADPGPFIGASNVALAGVAFADKTLSKYVYSFL